MNTTKIGKFAEDVVARYLENKGHKIMAANWRNRYCEIDIISVKNKTIYFTEVKYRKTNAWGDGLDAIGPKKLQQMEFASQLWANENNFEGSIQLIAISVSGDPPKIEDVIEI